MASSDAFGATSDAFASAAHSPGRSNDAFALSGHLPMCSTEAPRLTSCARGSAAYSHIRTNDALQRTGDSSVLLTDAFRLTSNALVASNDVSGSTGHALLFAACFCPSSPRTTRYIVLPGYDVRGHAFVGRRPMRFRSIAAPISDGPCVNRFDRCVWVYGPCLSTCGPYAHRGGP